MAGKPAFHSLPFLEDLIARLDDPREKPFENKQVVAQLQQLLAEFKQARDFDFREIGDHLYDGIYIADGDGKTVYVNKAYSRITGLKPEEVVGRYVEECEKDGLYKNAVTPTVIKKRNRSTPWVRACETASRC